jgi:RimJ/RimL family protein N-acetyltransferase
MAVLVLYSPDKKIRLTLPSSTDDEDVANIRSDPICRKYSRYLPETVSPAEVAILRESRAPNSHYLDFIVSALNDDGSYSFSGICNVFLIDATHMWGDAGIWIASDCHGQGLTTPILYMLLEHVFEARGLHRVSFMTGADNAPMRGWLEKVAGVRQEGTFKDCWKEPAGGWQDVIPYSILDHEWAEKMKPTLQQKMKEKGVGLPKDMLTV